MQVPDFYHDFVSIDAFFTGFLLAMSFAHFCHDLVIIFSGELLECIEVAFTRDFPPSPALALKPMLPHVWDYCMNYSSKQKRMRDKLRNFR